MYYVIPGELETIIVPDSRATKGSVYSHHTGSGKLGS